MKLSFRSIFKSLLSFLPSNTSDDSCQPASIPLSNLNNELSTLDDDKTIQIFQKQCIKDTHHKMESPSYFEWLVYNQHEVTTSENIPLRTLRHSTSSPHFHVYEHPAWTNWNAIWNYKPFILDPNLLPVPSIEEECHGAQFRLRPEFSFCLFDLPQICQGTSFVFKGFDNPHVRYVVEWCQWQDDQHAYLKVVGMRISGLPYPFNDPQHPTFILIIPRTLSLVPYPPQMITHPRYESKFKKKLISTESSKQDDPENNSPIWIYRSVKNIRDHSKQ